MRCAVSDPQHESRGNLPLTLDPCDSQFPCAANPANTRHSHNQCDRKLKPCASNDARHAHRHANATHATRMIVITRQTVRRTRECMRNSESSQRSNTVRTRHPHVPTDGEHDLKIAPTRHRRNTGTALPEHHPSTTRAPAISERSRARRLDRRPSHPLRSAHHTPLITRCRYMLLITLRRSHADVFAHDA